MHTITTILRIEHIKPIQMRNKFNSIIIEINIIVELSIEIQINNNTKYQYKFKNVEIFRIRKY